MQTIWLLGSAALCIYSTTSIAKIWPSTMCCCQYLTNIPESVHSRTNSRKYHMIALTDLNFFRKSVMEFCPFIDSATMDFAKDLELPGLPTTNRGILSSTHTAIMNTFSLKAALRAMFGPSTMLERNASWQLKDVEMNSNKNTLDTGRIELHHCTAWLQVLDYAVQCTI